MLRVVKAVYDMMGPNAKPPVTSDDIVNRLQEFFKVSSVARWAAVRPLSRWTGAGWAAVLGFAALTLGPFGLEPSQPTRRTGYRQI